MVSGDHDPHAPDAEDALNSVLPREDVAFAYTSRRLRTALHHALAPPIHRLRRKMPKLALFARI
jgi:hypothetical protein